MDRKLTEQERRTYELAISSLPPASEVFTNVLFRNPILPVGMLREVLNFYDVSPSMNSIYVNIGAHSQVTDIDLQILIWLAGLYQLPREKIRGMCEENCNTISFQSSILRPQADALRHSDGNNQGSLNPAISRLQEQVNHLRENVTELSSMRNRPIQRRILQFEIVDETRSNRTP